MMEGLKKRTRKAFGIRKKEKDNDSTGSPDRDGGSQKKTNGAPNGFYGDIDWDRYNSPEVDDEGYSIRPDEESEEGVVAKAHFFSSDESEEDEDRRKKFKIKIKPLLADHVVSEPSVDVLKASIGNIALSPSPLRTPRRSPGLKGNTSGEEIARPRRVAPAPVISAPAPAPAPPPQPPRQQTPVSEDSSTLFGPPLETTFGEEKVEVVLSESDVWGTPLPEPDSSLTRFFPAGSPPPLPPKNVPTSPPASGSPSADNTEALTEADGSARKSSIADLDNIFGPEQAPPAGEETSDSSWICFSEQPSEKPPVPKDAAPPLPSSPPPPEEPAPPPPPASPPPPESPAPPLPTSLSFPEEAAPSLPSPPTKQEPTPPLPTSPPPSEKPVSPPACSGPSTPEDRNPPAPAPKELASPSASSPPLPNSPDSVPPASVPKADTPPAETPPSEEPTAHLVSPPPVPSQEEHSKNTDAPQPKEEEEVTSPKDTSQEARSSPPPPPPPTYRAVVSSPGPTSTPSGTNSGSSSPVRPSTPSSGSPAPPPPPPRPPSRPKLPPGKPTVGDANRPFSPPIHSASPPPIAPLARAESTSSISSTNSLSAATTPTVNKELCVSVSDDAFVDKLPTFERHFDSFAENDQPSLVWFDRGKFYLTFEGCSRGPSPLTMGAQDTLPVAAAFTETVNAFFKGADPSKCVVKIIGEMVLSFPAGITRHFANNPSPAVLTFSITNYSRLEHVLPNPQLLCCDTTTQAKADSKDFWVNMPNLISHLKKVSEQKPQATYYNVDMLKYQVSTQGLQSSPLNLAVSWRCEPTSTDLRIDYKYNGEAMSTPMALNNVQFLVPVDGGVSKLQAVLPPAAWNAEQQRILWKIPDISQKSENGGVGSLLARFQLTEGPSKPAPLAVQFTSEGSTLSGCDIELAGPGYRFSLIKKRFAAGKYLADN
ncbi:SH3-containing GRB2-like protein 3-interacting protein 1 isoform X2 [Oryzias melastigma]|uniref:SH3-containing GRB2-like protein 3-interacting protein 1 isoform X2 n=1 Tax=Oryzias melastigma TaxID=30732 RepID=UPI000CF7CFE3|nr:SH3-containing GRB2-like protein 3-interacting protein 1 isoform X2 [Oryzias melastigma]